MCKREESAQQSGSRGGRAPWLSPHGPVCVPHVVAPFQTLELREELQEIPLGHDLSQIPHKQPEEKVPKETNVSLSSLPFQVHQSSRTLHTIGWKSRGMCHLHSGSPDGLGLVTPMGAILCGTHACGAPFDIFPRPV